MISKKSSHFSFSTRDEKLTVIAITIASLFPQSYAKKRINFEMFFEVKSEKMR